VNKVTDDIIKRARENYKRDYTHWSEIYQKARDDLFFLSDDQYAQWDEKDWRERTSTGRPALTIDQLSQFVHQVANDIRQNTPSINVIPAGKEADVETAEIFKGLIRNIEYVSNADDAYDTGALNAIKSSIGFIRVDHDYVDDETFDQELLVKRVINPLASFLDCDSVECDGSDAKHGTVIDRILVSDFKKKYPDKEVACFDDGGVYRDHKDDAYISIAEYFELDQQEREIAVTEGGDIENYSDGKEYKSRRKVKKTIVRRYKLSGIEILEETTFPGKYIPLVPVYGEEAWKEGRRHLLSLIRKSKEAQRMYNYWKSLETELLMKQPQAPVMTPGGAIEDFAEDWKNPSKSMALRYNMFDAEGRPLNKPERLEPPVIPVGVVNASRQTVDDIKATMGLYNASLGERSNETSGIAIAQRKQEGDVATFHFSDNLVRSITHVGRILVCAAPEIYDTARVIRIIGEEDQPKQVGVNGTMAPDQERPFDLTKGIYDVRVTTGASYTTRRQEAATFFADIVKQQPELMQIMGDLLFKNMDFTGAQAMAERMKKVIDPKFLEEEQGGEEVDPQKEQMAAGLEQSQQVIVMLQAEMAKLQEQIDSKEAEIQIKAGAERSKAENERAKLELELLKITNEKEKAAAENQFKMAALAMKNRELEIKELEAAARAAASQQSQFAMGQENNSLR
jgi:hypothetical protein